jgi:serine O-acetyltransferase
MCAPEVLLRNEQTFYRVKILKMGKVILPEAEWNRVFMPLHPYGCRGFFTEAIMRDLIDYVKSIGRFTIDIVKNTTKAIKDEIKSDILAVKERDPASRGSLEIFLLNQGLHAILLYRISHFLYLRGHRILAHIVSNIARFFTGIEIHPAAIIGKGLLIDHGMGVVIGATAIIGDDCTLFQGVTLGGRGNSKGKRHPTLQNGVFVGAGAKILGDIEIGDNAKIGANAVVLSDVPENATAVGVPARIIK